MNARIFVTTVILGTALSGCAASQAERRDAIRGALIGAAAGGVISAATGGDFAEGAVAGAAGGAAIGYITADGKRREVRHDRRGNRYWIDDNGRRRRVR